MTRNQLILHIEERITALLIIMQANAGINTLTGLPFPKATKAFEEWNLLRDMSTTLQNLADR